MSLAPSPNHPNPNLNPNPNPNPNPGQAAELCSLRSSNPAELGGEQSVRISWSGGHGESVLSCDRFKRLAQEAAGVEN